MGVSSLDLAPQRDENYRNQDIMSTRVFVDRLLNNKPALLCKFCKVKIIQQKKVQPTCVLSMLWADFSSLCTSSPLERKQ